MMLAPIAWGSLDWLLPAVLLSVAALGILIWAYRRATASRGVRVGAALLKALGALALALCLLEPLLHTTRARPGANLFVVLADNSQSLRIRDRGQHRSRGEFLRERLSGDAEWQGRLGQVFDVRRYLFDTRVRAVRDFSELTLEGGGSSLATALEAMGRRFRGRALAGVLLLTDGNATDLSGEDFDWGSLPPVYPVPIGGRAPVRDISLSRVAVSQSNFEAAPVTIRAEIASHGYPGEEIVARLFDEAENRLEETSFRNVEDGKPAVVRFQLRPERAGFSFYSLRVSARSELEQFENPERSREATLANNRRLVAVDRGGGPYRVLYVSGRLNWEFKFLRRALEEDKEVDLVGLLRIAKREPKFDYRGRAGESTNPLFRGFGNQDDEEAERYDQPVLLRIGTVDEDELRDGFPKAADQLYRYHAVILDDLEAEYFTSDQMSLLKSFVSQRGGGFLMLGGAESFGRGYVRTPIGDLLPVYVDRPPDVRPAPGYRLWLTREGWLEPWVRLRATAEEERGRFRAMPEFHTLNPTRGIKPGASVLARVRDAGGTDLPALAAHRFGKGRAAALTIGDLWRWSLRREKGEQRDLEKAWRQTVRWLVADVPQRIEVDAGRKQGDPGMPVELTVRVRDEAYEPLDNASVAVRITLPDGSELQIGADPSDRELGAYATTYVPRTPGAYRARVVVTAADGSAVGETEAGWTAESAADEFRVLEPNRALLERIARKSGGELVPADRLESFVADLPNRRVPVTEARLDPLWHSWWVFLLAMICITAEWGLRRWRGLP